MLPDLFHALFYGIAIVAEYYVRNKGRVSNIRAGIICYDGMNLCKQDRLDAWGNLWIVSAFKK